MIDTTRQVGPMRDVDVEQFFREHGSTRLWHVLPARRKEGWVAGVAPIASGDLTSVPVMWSSRCRATLREAVDGAHRALFERYGTNDIEVEMRAEIVTLGQNDEAVTVERMADDVLRDMMRSGRVHAIKEPKESTLAAILEQYPTALWLIDGEQKFLCRTEDLKDHMHQVVIDTPQKRFDDLGVKRNLVVDDFEQRWRDILAHRARWYGGNLHLFQAGEWSWFMRIMATGKRSDIYMRFRDVLKSSRDLHFADKNPANATPGDDTWFINEPSGSAMLNFDYTAISPGDEDIRERFLDQVVTWDERGRVFACDPISGQAFYLCEIVKRFVPKKLPVEWRSDAPMIRALMRWRGEKTALAWQSTPLVQVPESYAEMSKTAGLDHLFGVAQTVPDLTYRPWRDVTIDFGYQDVPESIKIYATRTSDGSMYTRSGVVIGMWTRVCEAATWAQRATVKSPWIDKDSVQTLNQPGTLIVETMMLNLETDRLWLPLVASVSVEKWADGITTFWDESLSSVGADKDGYAKTVEAFTRIALSFYAYMAQTDEHLVEVRQPGASSQRKHQPKPWVTAGLPKIVLMRPGQQTVISKRNAQGGHHRSPIGHDRAGHWKTLRHPRFYHGGWGRAFVDGSFAQDAPPIMNSLFYDFDTYRCGQVAGRVEIWRKLGSKWWNVQVRRFYIQETWVGPRTFEDEAGAMYHVLERENDRQRVIEEGGSQ